MKKIEVFRAGTHRTMNGTELHFGEADLAKTAAVYSPGKHEAPLVIGHPASDGPAYGWVESVSCEDGRLAVEPKQVDPAFAELVEAGLYKKISASFYTPNSPANPVPGSYYLRHVGFLGAQPPAVKGLKPVEFGGNADDCVTFEFGESGGRQGVSGA